MAAGGEGSGGEGELNIGGGGMTPMSVTAMDRSGMSPESIIPLAEAEPDAAAPRSMPFANPGGGPPGWLGVTRSLGSMERGLMYFEPEKIRKM